MHRWLARAMAAIVWGWIAGGEKEKRDWRRCWKSDNSSLSVQGPLAHPCAHREFLWAKALCAARREGAKLPAAGAQPRGSRAPAGWGLSPAHLRAPGRPGPSHAPCTPRLSWNPCELGFTGNASTFRLSFLTTHKTGASISYGLLNEAGRQLQLRAYYATRMQL